MTVVTVVDVAATGQVAAALAPLLEDGSVIELRGDLGAGKTTFVQALGRAAGVTEPIRSPTFTVAHSYAVADDPSVTLSHLDLYRSPGGLGTEAWADVEPYFDARLTCVEWPDPLADAPLGPRPVWRIELRWPDRAPATVRTMRIEAPDAVAQCRCADVLARVLR